MLVRSFLLFVSFFCFVEKVLSQYVETAVNHPKIIDGLYADSKGNIYTTPGGLQGGFTIGIFNEVNGFNPNFATGFNGPINIAKIHDSLLIVSNFDNSTLKTYNLNSGEVLTVVSGMDGPAGIAVDGFNNTYFSNFGWQSPYDGHTIYKYNNDGELSLYIDSQLLFRPQGMTFDHHGILYLASMSNPSNDGKIYKVDPVDSTLQLFANIGTTIGNMTFRQKDSSLYFPSQNRIMKVDLLGNIETVTGSITSGYQDGQLNTAKFQNPLGIAFSVSEDTMYISEAGGVGRLRRIVLSTPTSTKNIEVENLEVYPNPAKGHIALSFKESIPEDSSVYMYNSLGELMKKQGLKYGSRMESIQIADYPNGLYFLSVKKGNISIYLGKFIKKE